MKGYRTLIIGAIIAILGIAEGLDWVNLVPQEWADFIIGGIGLAMMYLRKITTTPIGDSGTDTP